MPKYNIYLATRHTEKFDSEPNKSGLINLLLDRHYDYFQPGTLVEEIMPDDMFPQGDLRDKLDEMRGKCKKCGSLNNGKCLNKSCL